MHRDIDHGVKNNNMFALKHCHMSWQLWRVPSSAIRLSVTTDNLFSCPTVSHSYISSFKIVLSVPLISKINVCPSNCLVQLSVCPSVCLSNSLSIHLIVCPTVCMSNNLSVCLSLFELNVYFHFLELFLLLSRSAKIVMQSFLFHNWIKIYSKEN